ncbi:MAG: tetratricopeptide repeat protein [Ignavibacteriales bacterium]|nr:tetratricopeptide repeat protein [Ignavibacteriales bacterium]
MIAHQIRKLALHFVLLILPFQNISPQEVDSLKKLIKFSNDIKKVDLLNELASNYYYSYPDSTILYANIALELAKNIDYKIGEARALDCIGNAYDIKGEYNTSLNNYIVALKIREDSNDSLGISDSYFNIGTSYYHSGFMDKALEYCQKSLDVSEKISYRKGNASVLDMIGNIYYELKKFDKALNYYERSLDIERDLEDKQGIVISLSNIADIFDEQGKYTKALKYYYEAVDICKNLNDKIGIAILLNNIGYTLLNLQRYDEAKNNFIDALKIAAEFGDRNLEMQVYESFAELYTRTGDYKNALENFKSFTNLKDSLFNEVKSEQIADIREKYQTEKIEKDKKILELTNKELETTKIYLITGLVLFFLISTAIYYRIKLKQKTQELRSTEKILRVQMNPHFISNSLVAVQNYLMSEDIDNSIIYISNFSDLMRRVIQNSELEYIFLAKEIEELQAYLELEKLSIGEKFNYKIIVEESLEINDIQIPPMLIQPYLENSILHGFTGKEDDCLIKLSFNQTDSHLFCTIEDNGVGREESLKRKMEVKKYKSIGQQNVERRIQLINKLYKTNFKVKIIDLKNDKSEPLGTRVELNILIS